MRAASGRDKPHAPAAARDAPGFGNSRAFHFMISHPLKKVGLRRYQSQLMIRCVPIARNSIFLRFLQVSIRLYDIKKMYQPPQLICLCRSVWTADDFGPFVGPSEGFWIWIWNHTVCKTCCSYTPKTAHWFIIHCLAMIAIFHDPRATKSVKTRSFAEGHKENSCRCCTYFERTRTC